MGSVRPGRTHSAAPTLNGSFASNCDELEESIDMDDPPPPPPLMRDSIKVRIQTRLGTLHRLECSCTPHLLPICRILGFVPRRYPWLGRL